MDLCDVQTYRPARTRQDLSLSDGEQFVAGGTWMFSETQPGTTGLVDLTTMGWTPLECHDDGLRIASTCTIADLVAFPSQDGWSAQHMFADSADALLASFKIWNEATVGGNICRSFAAASMVSLAVGLDGVAVVWPATGGEHRIPVAELITGNGTNGLLPGEVLRAVELPGHALRSRARLVKIALAELGRSGAVVTGRVDEDGSATFGVTAAVAAPRVLRYRGLPDPSALRADVEALDGYYTDPLGPADWRRAVSGELAVGILADLEGIGS